MMIGIQCPVEGNISFEECLKHRNCMDCGLPLAVRVEIMKEREVNREQISVTSVLHCVRKVFFERTSDYYATPKNLFYLFRGNLIHEILKDTAKVISNVDVEQFVNIELDGIKLSGRYDYYDSLEKVLIDYKTVQEYALKMIEKDGGREDDFIQLNLYRVMLGKEVKEMYIYYFVPSKIVPVSVPFMDDCLDKIRPKVNSLKHAFISYENFQKLEILPETEVGWICKFCYFTEDCPGGMEYIEKNKK